MTFKEARTEEFTAMLAEWGTALTVGSLTPAACIKTPDRAVRDMTPTGYLLKQVATFDIFTTEWTRLGLDSRKQFDCEGTRYEIVPKSRDTSEPTIQFTAERMK